MKTKDAVRFFGTQAELARALGIKRQSVNDWGDVVPLARQYQLERLTQGKLKAPEIRPYAA